MTDPPIYLDNHATTRVDPRVVEAMLPYFSEDFGNPGSVGHAYGEIASQAVETARASIASILGASPREIVFTSGATESNNLAIRGVALRRRRRGNHLLSVQTEHASVLEPLNHLAKLDYQTTFLKVEQHGSPQAGWLDPEKVAEAITDETALVSVMLANNETGIIQPLADIAAICKQRGVLLHCDATQAVGKIPVDVQKLNVDLLSFSAHKIYGPKGMGALYIRGRDPIVRLEPQIIGGGQQQGRRSGTLNVPGIVGFAKALELCNEELVSEQQRHATLRTQLWNGLSQELDDLELCGPSLEALGTDNLPLRLPGNLNFSLGNIDGEALQLSMSNLAVSSGATCASSDPGPSHVLLALGLFEDRARSSLRIGLGRFNTKEDIDIAIRTIVDSTKNLKKLASH